MYTSLIKNIETWQAQDDEDSSKIIFAKGARSCEIGETVYQPKKSHLRYRAIIIRALKPDAVNKLILTEEDYDYQGWVSSIDESMPCLQLRSLNFSLVIRICGSNQVLGDFQGYDIALFSAFLGS
jgi:hypothetical protein